ncbi:hypothetical protein EKO04_010033 [Ascochyta lentis]|uniref:Uncharacterized protein n=1 Tax=Ascochyta lentis TaxID=205686 RepID=A0A8H7ITT3_9PLEO|nr:hypothetical protein EKO04_010033 [Ascochyta lentis]
MLLWQFANIQALDFSLPQVALEGDCLYDFLFGPMGWHPEARHNGVLVAPYVSLKNTVGGTRQCCGFTLLPTGVDTDECPLTDALERMDLPSWVVPPPSTMRLQRARPLVHLTLRLSARNWWTWTDDPSSTDALHHHLGLEPALGNGSADLNERPDSTRMQELARQRRDGDHPAPRSLPSEHPPGWAHTVARLPDLKTLELILETFGEKRHQLEKVVECAKTWRFPIVNTQHELAWDTRVEEKLRSQPVVENWQFQRGYRYAKSTEIEVRIVRFTRQ